MKEGREERELIMLEQEGEAEAGLQHTSSRGEWLSAFQKCCATLGWESSCTTSL